MDDAVFIQAGKIGSRTCMHSSDTEQGRSTRWEGGGHTCAVRPWSPQEVAKHLQAMLLKVEGKKATAFLWV